MLDEHDRWAAEALVKTIEGHLDRLELGVPTNPRTKDLLQESRRIIFMLLERAKDSQSSTESRMARVTIDWSSDH